MMAISTGGIGPVDITTTSSQKSKSKDDVKATDAFSSLMNMTSNSKSDSYDNSGVTETKTTEYRDSTNTKKYDNSNKESDKPVSDYKSNEVKSNKSDEYDKEEIISDIAVLIQNVKNIVTEALDITDGELEDMLGEMGLSIGDLLDASNMKDFILKTQNVTEIDMLINENLADIVNGAIDNLDALLEQLDISDVSDFIDKFADAMEEFATSHETAVTDETVSQFVADGAEVTEEADIDTQDKVNITETAGTEVEVNNSINTNQDTHSGDSKNHDNKNYNNIVENLSNAIDSVIADESVNDVTFNDSIDQADIIRQIIDDIKVSTTKSITSMEVQLNPENLGKVHISVASKNGMMQAQIVAETEAAKHAIENSIATLKEAFNNQELKVEAVEVTVASYEFFNQDTGGGFEENNQNNSSGRLNSIGQHGILSDDDMSEEEQHEAELMKAKGSSVSYSV